MELPRPNQLATQVLKSQKGVAIVLCLSILPILLAAIFVFLFSNYLVKNWMQSLYVCRTELLKTQSKVSKELRELLLLNPTVAALRMTLIKAQAEYQMALLTENPPLAAHALSIILKTKGQQAKLDQIQRRLIFNANLEMNTGPLKVKSLLMQQDAINESLAPSIFRFQIHSIYFTIPALAIRPDRPDIAPLYELKNDFTASQRLSVSWKSSFRTNSTRGLKWIQNQHAKFDSCGASLKSKQENQFQEILSEAKPY